MLTLNRKLVIIDKTSKISEDTPLTKPMPSKRLTLSVSSYKAKKSYTFQKSWQAMYDLLLYDGSKMYCRYVDPATVFFRNIFIFYTSYL